MAPVTSSLHTLNTLPSADVAELAASTPKAVHRALAQEHYCREFAPQLLLTAGDDPEPWKLSPSPFLFANLPGRLDGGIDDDWSRASHRARQMYRRWKVESSCRRRRHTMTRSRPAPVYVRGPVNGAIRGVMAGLVIELVVGALIVAGVMLRNWRHA